MPYHISVKHASCPFIFILVLRHFHFIEALNVTVTISFDNPIPFSKLSRKNVSLKNLEIHSFFGFSKDFNFALFIMLFDFACNSMILYFTICRKVMHAPEIAKKMLSHKLQFSSFGLSFIIWFVHLLFFITPGLISRNLHSAAYKMDVRWINALHFVFKSIIIQDNGKLYSQTSSFIVDYGIILAMRNVARENNFCLQFNTVREEHK